MVSSVEGVTQSGVISTQVERVQADRAPAPPPAETPPSPPVDSGRGGNVDTSA